MKKTVKKGFTLVELLVVIAILAILATVSVVGYTAFIQRATVSNDENVAAQLNQFLTAMKADSTGEYYEVLQGELAANEILEITDEIIKESGLTTLAPQAEQYGYAFYFDLLENKYVVMETDKAFNVSLMYYWLNISAYSESGQYELIPQNMFSEGGRYLLIDTQGLTDLGEILNLFRNVKAEDDYDRLREKVDAYGGKLPVREYFNATVFVTDEGNFGSGKKYVVFADGLTKIENPINTIESNGAIFRIPNSVKYIAPNALNVTNTDKVTFVIGKTVEQVGEIANEPFTNAKLVTLDGPVKFDKNSEGESVISTTDDSYSKTAKLEYYNPAVDFTIYIKEVENHAARDDANSAFVGYDVESFELLISTTPAKPGFPCTTKAEDLIWTVPDGADITNDKNVFNYTKIPDGEVSISATLSYTNKETNKSVSEEHEYTIKTVLPNNFSLTLNGKTLSDSSRHSLSYTSGTASSYYLGVTWHEANKYNYDTNGKIEVNETPKITLSDGTQLIVNDTNLKIDGNKSGQITEEIIFSLANYTIAKSITLYDSKDDLFDIVNGNITYVGNENGFKASDFFKLKKGKSFPEGATLMVLPAASDTEWDNYDKKPTSKYITSGKVDLVSSELEDEAQFVADLPESLDSTKSYLCIVVDGVRVSPFVTITAKSGYNVRSYKELKDNIDSHNIIVLADEITMPENTATLTVQNKQIWGNGAEFNVKNGSLTYGTIELRNSELHDLKIIGKVFSSFQFEENKENGAAAVKVSNGTCRIENCYIANCREPISISSKSTLNLKDSVVFGGRMSNIDIRSGGKLIIEGTVTTVQTPYKGVIGMGISCWFDDSTKEVEIAKKADLKQYNFLNSDNISTLPKIVIRPSNISNDLKDMDTILGIDVEFSVADFPSMFNELVTKDTYNSFWFGTSDGYYANSGIVCIDKCYGITPTITTDTTEGAKEEFYCYSHKTTHPKGYNENIKDCCTDSDHGGFFHVCGLNRPGKETYVNSVTIKVTKSEYNDSPNTEFGFIYDKTKFSLKGNEEAEKNATDNIVSVTQKFGAQTVFTYTLTNITTDASVTKSNYTTYVSAPLEISSWLTVTGANGYGSTDYSISITGWNIFEVAKLESLKDIFAGRGIHTGTMTVDIRSLDAKIETNTKLYHDHLHIAEVGAYNPENVSFNKDESGCKWTVTIPTCADTDNDQKCDTCGKDIPQATEGE